MNDIDVGIALHGPPHLREERLRDLIREAVVVERAACEAACEMESRSSKENGLIHEALGALWCASAIRKRGD